MPKVNPIQKWRGSRSFKEAARLLQMSERSYATLEGNPLKSEINSDTIIRVSQITGISLEDLINYLTD